MTSLSVMVATAVRVCMETLSLALELAFMV